jgi:hypothetical protein
MNNKEWKVYKLTSPTGRVYIGCTKLDLEQRWQSGRNYKSNVELFNDIIAYGWNSFTKELIADYDLEDAARDREHSEIQNYPDGYNIYRGLRRVYNPDFEPVRKAVLCVETGVIYESIYQAAKATGCNKQKISKCCRGIDYKSTGGYHWKFVS